jgi:hypothetical protein
MSIRQFSCDAAAFVASGVALAMACHGRTSVHEEDAARHIETIVYSDTQLMYSAPETLTVRADRTVRYESYTNAFRQAQQDIGVYEATITEASLNELESAVLDPPLDVLHDHSGRLGFDGRVRTISVTFGDRAVTKSVGTNAPVDPRLERIMARLDGVSKTALASPLRVLHLDLEHVTVDDQRGVEATAVFSNRSPQGVQCRAPTSLVGEENGVLALDSWSDTDPTGVRWVRTPVTQTEELSRSGGAVVQGHVLDLPPGAAISYRIRATLAKAEDGPASVQLVYRNQEILPAGTAVLLMGEVMARAKATFPKSPGAAEPQHGSR